jgi:ABC-type amino acid transport substrate-binding protein
MIARLTLLTSVAVALTAMLISGVASARPLASIMSRGRIVLCANPNALPFASKHGERQGIQIELGKALADQLGVGLEIGWVVFPTQIRIVDCDIVLDSIVDEELRRERRVRFSRPYQQSSVVLAFRPGLELVDNVAGLEKGLRIGALVGSLSRLHLAKQGIATIPYAFEDEMVNDLSKGELDVAAVSPASVGYHNFSHPTARVRATAAFGSMPELNWAIAVGVRGADDALIASINAALDKLLADGTIHRIYATYGIEQIVPKSE